MIDFSQLPNRRNNGASRGYVGWDPYEDYLNRESDNWSSRRIYNDWKSFDFTGSDNDLNLVADFYFEEETQECSVCMGSGESKEVQHLSNTFPLWEHNITEDEFEALKTLGRTRHFQTVSQMNNDRSTLKHDCINQFVIVKVRAIRLYGKYENCAFCDGEGALKTGNIGLCIWMLHPRKGASRAIHIKKIEESELSEIKEFLKKSYEIHTRHFSWAMNDEVK